MADGSSQVGNEIVLQVAALAAIVAEAGSVALDWSLVIQVSRVPVAAVMPTLRVVGTSALIASAVVPGTRFFHRVDVDRSCVADKQMSMITVDG